MLQHMRKHARYFYVLFFIVILTFVFWGVNVDQDAETVVADIARGEKISLQEYWRTYESVVENYRELYPGKFDKEAEEAMNLRQLVLESLIAERLLYLAAKDAGLSVGDAEVADNVMSNPAFQENGDFSSELYKARLFQAGLTRKKYEDGLRRDLLVKKMESTIKTSAVFSDSDLKGLEVGEELKLELEKGIRESKERLTVESFVNSLKEFYEVKVYQDRIPS